VEPAHDVAEADEPPPIRDRPDTGGGWWAAWPLAALALIGLLVVRACVPSLPATAPLSPPPASTTR
jgi:hypothetical protein